MLVTTVLTDLDIQERSSGLSVIKLIRLSSASAPTPSRIFVGRDSTDEDFKATSHGKATTQYPTINIRSDSGGGFLFLHETLGAILLFATRQTNYRRRIVGWGR